MGEDPNDRFRKAAGIPTAAEVKAKSDSAQAAQAGWEAKQPQRDAFLAKFNAEVAPSIRSCFAICQSVVKEGGAKIDETPVVYMGKMSPSRPLADRHFQLSIASPDGQLTGPNSRQATLDFILTQEGSLSWAAKGTGGILGNGQTHISKGPEAAFKEMVNLAFEKLLTYMK